MKRKILIIIMFFFVIINLKNKCFSVSEDFKFVIDTIGIPQYNVYGDEINEDIYYSYNIFVYSNPLNMYSKTNTQRFKAVPNQGKWTENGGRYWGVGVRGEYYVLGTSYSGSIIDNVFFPVDRTPETTPEYWRYISFAGAYESWFDTTKYKYVEQLEFMKNTNLLFDKLDYTNNTSDSYNLVEYNIKPINIGLDKARLNTSSTWKTMGIVTIKRINNLGEIRNAIMAVRPMAANADIKSNLSVMDNVIIDENTDEVNIPIDFGAEAINLNNYAKKEHIKEITSTIYINGQEYAKVSSAQVISVNKSVNLNINRENYLSGIIEPIHIEVVSYLYTEFSVDGLMKNVLKKDIAIQINSKKTVPVKDIELKNLEIQSEKNYVIPFIKTNISNNSNSLGIVEAGRNLALKINFDQSIEDMSKLEVYLNDEKCEVKEVISLKNDLKNSKIISFKLKEGLKNTLVSWNYLRDKSNNYFKINFDEIGDRVKEPNKLKVVILDSKNEKFEKEILFDSIDNYNINMNYIFDKNVINKYELNQKQEVEDWINN